MFKSKHITAVIVAGGKGTRMKSDINKQFLKINNKEILAITIEKFENVKEIDEIILVTAKEYLYFCEQNIVKKYGFCKVNKIIAGGKTRQQSVHNGLRAIENSDIILIHDGARPFVNKEIILTNIKNAIKYKAVCTGVKVKDTIKFVSQENYVLETLDREKVWSIQTPQTFQSELILKSHQKAQIDNCVGTDDSFLVERLGHKIKMIEGSYLNIKITTPEDILLAEVINKL